MARKGAAAWNLVDLLMRQPVINAAAVAAHLGVASQNAYRTMRSLLEAGVVVASNDHVRGVGWRAPEVLTALDQFAARSGRRTVVGC